MGHIQQVKSAKIDSHVIWLHNVFTEPLELPSPQANIRLLHLEWTSKRQLLILYHDNSDGASSIALMPKQGSWTINLASSALEISRYARFFVTSTPEEANEKDYVQITYIG